MCGKAVAYEESMTEMAIKLGYYDQPQFIRDFKTYCGTTPNKYLKLIESKKKH